MRATPLNTFIFESLATNDSFIQQIPNVYSSASFPYLKTKFLLSTGPPFALAMGWLLACKVSTLNRFWTGNGSSTAVDMAADARIPAGEFFCINTPKDPVLFNNEPTY